MERQLLPQRLPRLPPTPWALPALARIVAGTLIIGISPKCMAMSGTVASVVVVEITTEAINNVRAYWSHLAVEALEPPIIIAVAPVHNAITGRPTITPAMAVKLS